MPSGLPQACQGQTLSCPYPCPYLCPLPRPCPCHALCPYPAWRMQRLSQLQIPHLQIPTPCCRCQHWRALQAQSATWNCPQRPLGRCPAPCPCRALGPFLCFFLWQRMLPGQRHPSHYPCRCLGVCPASWRVPQLTQHQEPDSVPGLEPLGPPGQRWPQLTMRDDSQAACRRISHGPAKPYNALGISSVGLPWLIPHCCFCAVHNCALVV